ncbi:MAG TPA: endolytic transglycosylase MltG, partial [Bacteroidales bacterium]|nr:endolytic transglycosylase MltG [Bacteroidales bacterium]
MKNYYHDKYGPDRRKKIRTRRVVFTLSIAVLFLAIGLGIYGYRALFKDNVWIADGSSDFIYVRSNPDFQQFKKELYAKGLIVDRSSFEWVCKTFHLNDKMRPGRYELKEGMGNLEICRLLSSGRQVPVRLIFHNIRTNKQLAGKIGKQIEADSTELLSL